MKRRMLVWLPFALGLVLLALFYVGLKKPQDHVIASRMVGKPLPEFTAKPIIAGQPGAATADYRDGKPRLLNVFASWCLPCVVEIPVLMRMKAMGAEVDGIAVHDTPEALQAFLAKNGNPYTRIGSDDQSRIQMALGSSGVPETFVIDGKGIIVHQHIGVVSEADVPKLLEMLGQAK
jgi:cytochrome c biogenesis protein CcmG, thiol:disulfide interchange protein DsbE